MSPVLLALLMVATCAAVMGNEAVISSVESEELDPLTAATLESFGGFLDAAVDDVEEDDQSYEEEESLTSTDEVLHAYVNDEGMVEIEDMVVSPDLFEVIFPAMKDHPGNTDQKTIHRRAAVSSKTRLWPGGRIAYTYNSNLMGSESKVRAAMDEWEKYTCVKFEYKKSSEKGYVQVRTKMDSHGKPVPSCSSAVGYTRKTQYINLAKACFAHKTLLHELGHTIGLIHEHQHPSRDKYVTVIWGNVNPTKKGNFTPRSKSVSSYGIAYDPTSIMHYGSSAFHKKGCKSPCYTIKSKQGDEMTKLIGKAKHLSTKSDIPIVQKMYCSSKANN